MSGPAIKSALVVSSRHLDEHGEDYVVNCDGASSYDESIVAFGLRATADDVVGPDMPPCLANLFQAASEKGCAFLIIDTLGGGAALPRLPTFEEGGA